jgi:acetylornithine deacetylase
VSKHDGRGHPDGVAWLERLVAYPTVAGTSNHELISEVESYLTDLNIASAVIPAPREGASNLYAEIGPAHSPGVLLSGHTDVVAADGGLWASDPFRVERRGSRLYGRGTTDMKGFIAAVLAAIPRLATLPLRRSVALALSADEELGVQGVYTLLDYLVESQRFPSVCIVGEPTGMKVAIAHKGKVAFHIH